MVDTNGNDTIVEIANQSEESDEEVGRYVPSIDLEERESFAKTQAT